MALIKLNNQSLTAVSALPAAIATGKVLQVKYTQFTGTSTIAIASSGDGTALNDLTVDITPTSTNSTIMLTALFYGEFTTSVAHNCVGFFFKDTTKLAAPYAGNRHCGIQMGANISYYESENSTTPEGYHYNYFDTPSTTSQITYKVGLLSNSGTDFNINKTSTDSTDAATRQRGISSITAMEIAA